MEQPHESECRSSLSAPLRARLAALEVVVERGLATFVEVGQALLEIRDERLYRETHPTFEAYCQGRWGFGRSYGYELIDAARAALLVSGIPDTPPPANAGQAAELAPLLPDEQALVETWRQLRDRHGEQLTAEVVRGAVEERLAREAFSREPSTETESKQRSQLARVSPRAKRAGLYELGRHRILCGDATAEQDVERLLGGERAALLITSPPYLDLRRFGAGQDLSVAHLARFLPVFADRVELLVVNLGLIRRQATVVRYWEAYLAAAERAGLRLLAWNVWDKGAGGAHPSGGFFPPQHEWLFCFGRKPRPLYRTVPNENAGKLTYNARRQRDGRLKKSPPLAVRSRRPIGSVLTLPQEKANRAIGHPAPFPVGLPKAYIEALTEPGDIVVDPFLGAGTTLVACELTDRRCFGLELEPSFCDLARARHAALAERQGSR